LPNSIEKIKYKYKFFVLSSNFSNYNYKKMISYEEYKKLNNIENNQYIEFLDVSS